MSDEKKKPDVFDTESWVTVRMDKDGIRTRVYVRAMVHDKPVRWVTRHFDVNTPEEIEKILTKVLADRVKQLDTAGKVGAYEARKIAITRKEIEEVMQ